MSKNETLNIVAGKSWEREFTFLSGGAPVGNDKWKAQFTLWSPGTKDVHCALNTNGTKVKWVAPGKLKVSLTAEDTAQLKFLSASWGVILIDPKGVVHDLASGTIIREGNLCKPKPPKYCRPSICLKQGSYFGYAGELKDKASPTQDFTGWSVHTQIRTENDTVIFSSGKITPTAAGVFAIGADTKDWPIGTHQMDFAVVDAKGRAAHTKTIDVTVAKAVTQIP